MNQKCIRKQKVSFKDSRRNISKIKENDERLLRNFDIVINSTGIGTLGRVAFVKWLEEKETIFDSHISLVRANSEKITPEYLSFTLLKYQPIIESAANGSTGQVELGKSFLENLNILVPKTELQRKFKNFLGPLIKDMARREEESEELIKLRDWLHPMLMNCQVTVV